MFLHGMLDIDQAAFSLSVFKGWEVIYLCISYLILSCASLQLLLHSLHCAKGCFVG